LTHKRHWQCIAAMVLLTVLDPRSRSHWTASLL
jgi:hypothetical protein